ncbi:MAG TPA: alpha/beta hydrolase [Candidatus Lustribacter sp.]|jgi:pimeloyl-ACP methyl ester carboxylesterase|nr:alpha/beta hydrolase [Candidatus Lustribacter sp.]
MTVISEASTSKYAMAGDVKIHYNEVGTGPAIVCLNGAGPGASSWSNFQHNVEAFAREHRVLLVDMPQYGKSAKIPIAYPKLTNLARIMRDFMDAIGLERAHFVGNSFGGQMALKTAIDYPDRVGHLVMIGSAPVSYSLFSPQPVEGVKLIGGYYKDGGPSLEKMRKVLTTLVFDASRITDEVVRERYEASIDPETVAVHSLPAPKKQDLSAELGACKSPTLVVWGMDDRAGALDVGLVMTRLIPNAQMHIFNNCGHWAQVEHAAEFSELVLGFFKTTK